jgi:hypothetical protein
MAMPIPIYSLGALVAPAATPPYVQFWWGLGFAAAIRGGRGVLIAAIECPAPCIPLPNRQHPAASEGRVKRNLVRNCLPSEKGRSLLFRFRSESEIFFG